MSHQAGDVLQSNCVAMSRHRSSGRKEPLRGMADSLDALSLASQTSTRHRRSDAGPRLTDRDLACLKWIAQQYAIRLDQLQRLLLRLTPEEDKSRVRAGADRLSRERTYRTLA